MNINVTPEQAKVLAAAVNYYVSALETVEERINTRGDSSPWLMTDTAVARIQIHSLNETVDALIPLFLDIDTSDISEQIKEWEKLTR